MICSITKLLLQIFDFLKGLVYPVHRCVTCCFQYKMTQSYRYDKLTMKERGNYNGKLVELQHFPTLYGWSSSEYAKSISSN